MSLIFSVKRFFSLLAGILIFSTSFASGHSSEKEEKFNVGEMIMHHVSDAHEWHLWGGHHNSVSVYLPVILIDGGLKTFSSSHFYHGEPAVAVDHKTHEEITYMKGVGPAAGYAMHHEKIYKMQNEELSFEDGHVHGSVKPLDFSITKNVLSLFFGAVLILVILSNVMRFYRKNGSVSPRGLAKYLEVLILMVQDNIAKENIDKHKYKKYVPYLLTIFFFIFINNLLGLVPVIPGGANLTGNISVTLLLAVATLLVTLFSGNRNYWGHIFAMPGVPWPVLIILIPIELVGVFTKPFALMVRLFANMTAGHIIVLALVSIIFINQNATWGGLSVPMALFISTLELLVAFLQAFLFTMLSALFIGAAVEEAHH
ncbi:F0F1 ATP synthase subunit A [Fluviicola sp.]|jgi:F-type H+-transporting ATPase subunit a|uniref:F0F1 ATP synthase subunit A n=1 Tax=Fluviicola sp. TaxID=1917219 RepID=UPI00282399E9|nr:F0F1 ATP synthase subunit A [Fluviicola sp.]MDR0803374.1 F0F1 ATP synthase subunit A [Fluviicola sp.]